MARQLDINGLDPHRVAVVGDWHGNNNYALRALNHINKYGNADLILHLGDFGFWPTLKSRRNLSWRELRVDENTPVENIRSGFISSLDNFLAAHNTPLFFIDGNHENHPALQAFPINSTGIRQIASHIYHLPRGYFWKWHDKTYLALGGAVSVDAHMRTPEVDWFAQEEISEEDVARALRAGKVQAMFTHDTPGGYTIPGIAGNARWIPAHLLQKAEAHREVLSEVVDETRPEFLFHGHYHVSYHTERALPGGDSTLVTGLDCDGKAFARNIVIYDLIKQEVSPFREYL